MYIVSQRHLQVKKNISIKNNFCGEDFLRPFLFCNNLLFLLKLQIITMCIIY